MANGNGTGIEITEARRDVELAKADLRQRLREAGNTGKRLVTRVATRLRPALFVVAGVGALALAVGLYKIARGRRRPNRWQMPKRRSLVAQAVRSVLVSMATRLAAAAISRLPLGQPLELTAGNPPPRGTPE